MKLNYDCAKNITFRRSDQNMEFHITEILKAIIAKKKLQAFFSVEKQTGQIHII